MKRKFAIFLGIIFLGLFVFSACSKETDASKFKKEYESLNGTKSASGKDIREIIVDKDNPIIYKTAEEIVTMIENKETFVVYFGFPDCPWCRSVLPTLFEVSKDLNLSKIYYVNVKEIRDVLELNDKNEVVVKSKGSNAYYKLLESFKDVLSDYNLTDSNGKLVNTNEKRIYAPNVIGVVDGKANEMTTGISSIQTDAYMDLTEEMINETYNKFKCIIKCVIDNKNKNTCTLDKAC